VAVGGHGGDHGLGQVARLGAEAAADEQVVVAPLPLVQIEHQAGVEPFEQPLDAGDLGRLLGVAEEAIQVAGQAVRSHEHGVGPLEGAAALDPGQVRGEHQPQPQQRWNQLGTRGHQVTEPTPDLTGADGVGGRVLEGETEAADLDDQQRILVEHHPALEAQQRLGGVVIIQGDAAAEREGEGALEAVPAERVTHRNDVDNVLAVEFGQQGERPQRA
jgi:hypothetical protein